MWGLTLIGLGLMLGCFTRLASASGILVILLFYLCNPPFVGYYYSIPTEGSYLIVNKNLVEVAALAVILVTGSGRAAGLDRIIHGLLSEARSAYRGVRPARTPPSRDEGRPMKDEAATRNAGMTRREVIKTASLASLAAAIPGGLFAAGASERISVGLIGCGGRGTGAAIDCAKASPDVVITAMGDVFPDQLGVVLGPAEGEARGRPAHRHPRDQLHRLRRLPEGPSPPTSTS